MPWISRDDLRNLEHSVEVNKRHADQRLEDARIARSEVNDLVKIIESLGQVMPQVSELVKVEIFDSNFSGDIYYDLDRTGLDDLLASRERKRQDEFAAKFEKK
jgi:hypothetical protein